MESVNKKIAAHYWNEKLRGKTVVEQIQTTGLTTHQIYITPEEATTFNHLTGGRETAAFTVLLTVYSLLVQRYFGECALVAANVKSTVALFAVNPPGTATFREYLQQVKEEVQEVYKYADEWSHPAESYTHYHFAYNREEQTPVFPFSLTVSGSAIKLSFDENFISTFIAEHFLESVKRWIIQLDIHQAAATIPVISDTDKNIQLQVFNHHPQPLTTSSTLSDLFEQQAAATPDHTAVIFDEEQMTYRELNEAANRFASFLKDHYGISAGELAGIKLERNIRLPVAILGTLKTGAAYVPMDMTYPPDRLAYMETDCKCRLVVDDIVLNNFASQQHTCCSNNPERSSSPDDLAYVIYTSGTTGRPKGVMITHRNATALIQWAQREFDTSAFEVVFAATSHCFDLSIFEMFYPLSVGKTIRILQNALMIGKYLQQHTGILLNTVPAVMRTLLEEQHDLRHVSLINLAGEAFPVDIAHQLMKGNAVVRNLYGPSEDTTYSTCYRLSEKTYKTIPIGKPVADTNVYILDDQLQLLPAGIAGNLYLAGAGLSKGYLNQPELTRQKFIDNPFAPGTYMYDTGDLARWMPDGNLEFLGRKDQQIKLRGYRIEPEEIENTIMRFSEDIRQAVVILSKKETVLTGYYVAKGTPVDHTRLRDYLQTQLPAYMVPSHFVSLTVFPLNTNGKVDRKALGALPVNGAGSSVYVAPRNTDESMLAAIWQEVLGTEKISITDRFFELGGHSLMISQIINRMYKTMGKGVSFREFYGNPTIETLARALRQEQFVPIAKTTLQGAFPATPAQRRLWLLSQLDGGMQAYRIFGARRISGPLDKADFETAFARVVARHEILNTRFDIGEQGELCLFSAPVTGDVLVWKDLSGFPEPEKELQQYISIAGQQPLDLSKAPLFHAALIKTGTDDHVLLLTVHHIIADGWSLEVLTTETLNCYQQLRQGNTAALPPLHIQFRDYAEWLKNTTTSSAAETYWLTRFKTPVPVLQLPAAAPRPLIKTFNGRQLRYTFTETLSDNIRQFAREQQATLFMLLLSGVKVLLYRYSNEYDITVGTPVAGREHPDLEDQIGLYLNTLAIRTVLDANDTFPETVQKEKQLLLDAYAHQAFPFDSLVESLGQGRDTSRSPLFDVMVVLHNQQQLERHKNNHPGLTVTEFPIAQNTAHFDLTFSFTEEKCISLEIAYNTDIYAETFVSSIFGHLENLFAHAVRTPHTTIKAIDIITAAEKQQLLAYNDCKKETGPARHVVEKFLQQVALHPDNTAVVFEDRELSYAALDRRSDELAVFLSQQYPIAPEALIIIQLERSEWMIVSILAILKLGAAYVPVDPECPESRLQHILQDTGASVLINAALLEKFRHTNPVSPGKPEISISRDQLAYAIYTSGSTGVPKGVMITHDNLLHFLAFYDVGIHRTALTANYVFDASVMEIFAAITSGSTLVIPHKETTMDPVAYARFLYRQRITHCYMHPMHLLQIADQLGTYEQVYLRRILTGVEGIKKEAFAWYVQNGVTILNAYGPTEATIVSTAYPVEDLECITTANVPIGKPVPNYHVYIFNEDTQLLQPHGAIGELCVSGPGVGRGYLKRETLTSEKFEQDTLLPGARIYRTGDLARWLPDGNLEFIGRKDFQVKIRGNRVEPGEIEQVIQSWQSCFKNVLVTTTSIHDEKVLVAYYVTTTPIDKAALRSYLQEKLPVYMVPGYYVELTDIPLTVNGKIDRQQLPDIAEEDIIRNEFVAPRNATEQQVTAIWERLLNRQQVSVTDDFFELGGHSLLLTQLMNAYHRFFNVAVALKTLYAATTPEAHARLLGTNEVPAGYDNIPPAPVSDVYELSPAQLRYWLLYRIQGKSKEFNIYSTYALPTPTDLPAFNHAFNELLQRHEILRTVFITRDGIPKQQILPHQPVSIPVYPDEKTAAEQVFAVAFELDTAPLYRVGLVNSGREVKLFFNIHHIISDGWSMGIISRDLLEIYKAKITGSIPAIPELPVSYKDYAHWQHTCLRSAALAAQEHFWKTTLSGNPPYLQLPADYMNKAGKSATAAAYTVFIGEELQQRIKGLYAKTGTGAFAVFIAAFKVLLHRLTGEEDIIVGIPTANRNHYQLKDVAGCFLNTLMLRDKLDVQAPFEQLLRQTGHTLMQALENQQYPFEQLLEQLNIPKDDHRFPLSPVFFNMLDFEANTTDTITQFDAVHTTIASPPKFELECYLKSYANGYSIHGVYDHELFRKETIQYWMEAYISVLWQITANITTPPARLEIFTQPAWQEEDPAPTGSFVFFEEGETEQCIARRFEQQVKAYPDSPAVYCDGISLTYQQLNNHANHLAQQILPLAGDTTFRVALLLEHDATCVVGMLGTLKAGYAYVPVDVNNPVSRIRYMLEDAGCTVLVCSKATLEKAASLQQELPGLQLVTIPPLTDLPDVPNPQRYPDPSAEAYVLYTSGSTGMPKGVIQNRRNVLHYIRVYTNKVHIHTQDNLSVFSTYTFDASVKDIYGAILNGAVVSLYNISRHGLDHLEAWIRQQQITIIHMVPTVYRHFIKELPPAAILDTIRLVDLGGEPCYKSDMELFKEHFVNGALLVNDYGPTESTIVAQKFLSHHTLLTSNSIPLGKAVTDTDIFLLDENNNSKNGMYQQGEIAFSSPYLSLGYLNRKDLTSRAFIRDTTAPERRIYKSGDIGRRLPNGEIVFLQRKDTQVKLNGLRIELAEIEHQLHHISGIKEAVVLLKEVNGQQCLTAYINTGAFLSADDITSLLRERLPRYMVPSVYISVDTFPLTRTGKIDREALPAPTAADLKTVAYTAPENEMENRLAAIWATVLELDVATVGVYDNFFETGGNSLLAVKLINRINRETGITLKVKDLFNHPAIRELAQLISTSTPDNTILITPAPPAADYVLSTHQRRLWLTCEQSGHSVAYNIPVALLLEGPVDPALLVEAYRLLAARHDSFRTILINDEVPPRQKMLTSGIPDPEIHELADMPSKEELEILVRQESAIPFELYGKPLIRAKVMVFPGNRFLLTVVMHHIISDGWSMETITREWIALYAGLQKAQLPAWSPLTIQYRDFAVWQEQYMRSAAFEQVVSYWKERLAGTLPVLHLPFSNERPVVADSSGAVFDFTVEDELYTGLQQLAVANQATLFSVLFTAFNVLLHHISHQQEIILGTSVAGRRQESLESIVGFFVNTLAIRTSIDDQEDFIQLLNNTSTRLLHDFEHQDMPFEELLTHLSYDRRPGIHPVFQARFVLNSEREHAFAALEKLNISVNAIHMREVSSKFDLSLVMRPGKHLTGAVEYKPSLFKKEIIQLITTAYTALLTAILQQPHTTVEQLNTFDTAYQQYLHAGKKAAKESLHQKLKSFQKK